MNTIDWPDDLLDRFGTAEQIEISTRHDDGEPRGFVQIWIVRVGDALYVRSYRGTGGGWYRHATAHPDGVIRAAGLQVDVTTAPADPDVRAAVDAAYRLKYGRYGDTYLRPMLADQALAATLRINPAN